MWAALGAPKEGTGGHSALASAADWLILQGPAMPMFEGDPLVLRCQAWQDWPLTQVTFYRDGSALGPAGPGRELSIAALQEADSGHYHCSAMFGGPGPGSLETASPVAITVQGESEGQRGGGGGSSGEAGTARRHRRWPGHCWRRGQGAAFSSTRPLRAPVIPTLCSAAL